MRPLNLPIGSLMKFGVNRITDHKRSPIDIDYKRIEFRKRMVNGRLRRLLVAEKRTFKVSWEDLPKNDNQTVDGFWGALSLINFYETNEQGFDLTITKGDNSTEIIPVMFESFNYTITKRSGYTDLYNINMTLEEI